MTTPKTHTVRPAVRRLALSIRSQTQKHVSESNRNSAELAEIIDVDPLRIQLTHARDIVIDDENLQLTQWVKRYDRAWNLAVGDTVLVTRMRNEEFVVHDVVSENEMDRHINLVPNVEDLHTDVGRIHRSLDVYNANNDRIGLILLYDADTLTSSTLVTDPVAATDIPLTVSGSDVIWGHHVIRKVAVYDDDGTTILGYIPIFDAL